MNVCKGERVVDPLILNFVTRWRLLVNFTSPLRFTPRKKPRYRRYMSLGGPHSLLNILEKDRNRLPLPGFKPSIVQAVAILATLIKHVTYLYHKTSLYVIP
jgi:hypothetical protein